MTALISLLTFLIATSSVWASLVLHEERTSPPHEFVSIGPASVDQSIEFRVGLVSSDIDGLHDKLMHISTPGSPGFRQWLSADELGAYLRPSAKAVSAFHDFAEAHDLIITNLSPNGEWVSFTTTVGKANAIFGTNYETFVHGPSSMPIVRTLSVSLPPELVGHIDVMHPTTSFGELEPRLTAVRSTTIEQRGIPGSCNSTVTPTCLQDLYGIPSTPATQKKNTLLVTAYQDDPARRADLASFLKQYRPDINPATTFSLQTIDNGTNPQDPADAGLEANLDLEYTVGLATGVSVTFLQNGNDDFDTGLIDSASWLATIPNPPSVVTTSYGLNEYLWSTSFATKLCNAYMGLGARGISVIYASGDGGVRGGHDTPDLCTNNTFTPVFPASCPYVTTVGATIGINPERAVNFTGGGFSNIFSRPAYQSAAVDAFLSTVPPDFAGVYNKAGRAYPDVATQGSNFEVVVGGVNRLIGGTSASAPTFASTIALVNDRLVAAGKPVLGFMNPFFYSGGGSAFTDVTIGKNVGKTCPDTAVAFTATKGWDPLTGFGTPIFSKLLSLALAH